ncbi:GTPase family protein [Lederbergia wuyishanensis]|uniref:GTPase n=1 Tax=Lederbergia wuyishanensis TaxID=1347903 RepID=A0ABU0DB03_9BACI|nr:GTPase [Lederbergia wuyishanensis]MCJ8010071.1 50S ribosome-binding GTPase [Lederbergia wuyishanensis]MDQ0345585.1 putative GTPase [Lederbergia wuyishanensis]
MNKESQFDSVFNQLKGQLDKLPIAGNSKKKMLSKLSELKEITVDAREPRIALIGRRGAGKSSLINALFGEAKQFVSPVQAGTGRGKWFWYPSEDEKKIRLLDSRGLGESEKPIESTEEASAFDQLKKELEAEQPDVLLFLIKGKETDARIEEDLRELNLLRSFVKETHQYDVPVICVVTQVDELDPPYYKEVPFDANPIKAANIKTAVALMEKRFQEAEIPLLNIIPVCTYTDFNEEGNILFDMRWNVDEVASYLIDSLPNEAILKTAKAAQAKSVKKKVAQKIILTMSGIASIVALEPIPFADMPILTALQALMVMAIAYIAGREISRKTAAEFIGAVGANLGLAFAVREGVRSVVKLIPAAGNVISSAVAGAVTFGIGKAGIVYFIDGNDIKKAKKAFQTGKEQYKKD